MPTTVICTATIPQAEAIIERLKQAGFSGEELSVLLADPQGKQEIEIEEKTKAPEGAISGAGGGAALGGGLGWLAGIGLLAIPGVGPLIAAGPILAGLGGAALGGALGGLSGALVGMGVSELEAKQYQNRVEAGSALISVRCETNSEAGVTSEICEDGGATDVTVSNRVTSPENGKH
jgi:hypothetical protein